MPTFTTSNERMLLLLADGASGMLRVEDAERLQVRTLLGICGCEVLFGQRGACSSGRSLAGGSYHHHTPLFRGHRRSHRHMHLAPYPQGLPEGHTRPCWPIQTPGVGAHRARPPRTEADAEAAASKRWDLLGERVMQCSASGWW